MRASRTRRHVVIAAGAALAVTGLITGCTAGDTGTSSALAYIILIVIIAISNIYIRQLNKAREG